MPARLTLLAAALVAAAGCVEPAPAGTHAAAWDWPAASEPPVASEPAPASADEPEAPAEPAPAPSAGDPWPPGIHRIGLEVDGERALGLVAVPRGAPTAVVAVAHGWGGDAEAHRGDLERLAAAGAVAFAMDYRGPRGAFKVEAGVADTLAATRTVQERYPGVDRSLAYGWSMGGEVALLAAARAPPGTFDYVFVGAGVADLEAFWHEAPLARAEVERETGGTPLDVPGEYARRSPVLHAGDLAAQGLQRVFVVHAAADAIVPAEQAERLFGALRDAGVPVSFYAVTKDRTALCAAGICVEPPAPGDHGAGRLAVLWPFIEHRIARLPDPGEAAQRGVYDADTGAYDPKDTGG